MNLILDNVTSLLDQLHLTHWSCELKEDIKQFSPEEKKILLSHLKKWAQNEFTERINKRLNSRIRSAKFKKIQTIDNFDFQYNPSTKSLKKRYLELFNNIEKSNLPSAVFSGTAGLGKTHLSRALGYNACQKDLSVRFITASEMVNLLLAAKKAYSLEEELRKYRRPQVLIIDELGYVNMSNEASNLFFQVISFRHDAELGTIVTTNITFGEWNQIFANDAIAHAIVDRIASDAEVFYLEGESYRSTVLRKNKNKN